MNTQLEALAKLPQFRRVELFHRVGAAKEFLNRASDSMKAQQVKPACSLEREGFAACKALK
jgi:hypothetical protein